MSNGGPFQGTGEPVGPVIVNRNILHSDFSSENVGFGVTSGNEWVLGGLKDDIEAGELQIQTFLGGFNWLGGLGHGLRGWDGLGQCFASHRGAGHFFRGGCGGGLLSGCGGGFFCERLRRGGHGRGD